MPLEFGALPQPGHARTIQVLTGGARGLVLAAIAERSGVPWLVLASDAAAARACYDDCLCFNAWPENRLVYLPDSEILPYDPEPASSALVRDRAAALQALHAWTSEPAILITTAASLTRRLAGPSHWIRSTLFVGVGQEATPAVLAERLDALGYRATAKVRHPGDYAAHPAVLDVYAAGSDGCSRLRFRNGRVQNIQPLLPDTQRSTSAFRRRLACPPAREVPTTPEALEALERGWRAEFGSALTDPAYRAIRDDLAAAPLHGYLPLLCGDPTTLFDWLPADTRIFCLAGALEAAQHFIARARARFDELATDPSRRLLRPERLWLTPEELGRAVSARARVEEHARGEALGLVATGMTRQATLDEALAVLTPWFDRSKRLLLCVQTEARAEGMSLIAEMLGHPATEFASGAAFLASDAPVGMVRASLDEGFHAEAAGLTVLTEAEIFGQAIVQRDESDVVTATAADVMADFSLLQAGDPLVHVRYGVGRFAGLSLLDLQQTEQYLAIDFADEARVYVKQEDLDQVIRYHGVEADQAPLDAIGSPRWSEGLREALGHAEGTARQLLKLYAERAARPGLVCDPPGFAYEKFCRGFAFRETRDQQAAVTDIIADLTSERPMDRVVSGDVGFGKTEVAMRAAFVAAFSGYQVAVLVPTTLLAQQHLDTFTRRFSEFRFHIELLSRSVGGAAERQVLDGLADGSVDLVIGTHRLLKHDVKMPRLGLVIVDEEHRFGVRDKERLGHLREQVNVLSLTATPIPRTLSLAMHGVRDISIIATPPARRLSIRTLVSDPDPRLVVEAIERERLRGGQAFYLHNTIETLAAKTDELRALIPDARIEYAHGRMREHALEVLMRRFHAHEFDVLVSTTIIETGIDIPNANTIVIEDADRLGLAQLHQLRGRVGRAHRQAYCYLLKSDEAASDRARARLTAMQRTTGLGEGLILAHHDLAIRGAGELLGEAQAGDIQTIGYQLYLRLLERAIDAARRGVSVSGITTEADAVILLPFEGHLPDDFIENPAVRLSLLKRLAELRRPSEIEALREEIEDRFGVLPEPAEQLLRLASLRFPLRHVGVRRLEPDQHAQTLRIHLSPHAKGAYLLMQQWAAELAHNVRSVDALTYLITPDPDGSLAEYDGMKRNAECFVSRATDLAERQDAPM